MDRRRVHRISYESYDLWTRSGLVALAFVILTSIAAADYIMREDAFSEGGGKSGSSSFVLYDIAGQSVTGISASANYIESGGLLFFDMIPVVGIDESQLSHSLLPSVYSLSQNYPNPTTGLTSIRYGLPNDSYVDIRIYDISGRVVRTLVAATQPASYYIINWDGKDDEGKILPAGIYFLQLESNSYRAVKGLTLIR